MVPPWQTVWIPEMTGVGFGLMFTLNTAVVVLQLVPLIESVTWIVPVLPVPQFTEMLWVPLPKAITPPVTTQV